MGERPKARWKVSNGTTWFNLVAREGCRGGQSVVTVHCDSRTVRAVSNTAGRDVDAQTTFRCRQTGNGFVREG